MVKKYELFIKIDNTTYCNYYANKKDTKRALEYFVNVEHLDLDKELSLSKKLSGGHWYIFSKDEIINYFKLGGLNEINR